MKLSVMERIHLLSLLPKEGNLVTLKIVRNLQNDLGFSEKENKETGLTINKDNRYEWKKDIQKEVDIGDTAKQVIKDMFEELDKNKKLNMQTLELYERFVL